MLYSISIFPFKQCGKSGHSAVIESVCVVFQSSGTPIVLVLFGIPLKSPLLNRLASGPLVVGR